jgi:hypothetical protein
MIGAFIGWEARMGERGVVPLSVFTKEVVLVLLALWWGWMRCVTPIQSPSQELSGTDQLSDGIL